MCRLVDHLFEALRSEVKRRNRRGDDRSILGHGSHGTKVTQVEWALAYKQDQSPPFLKVNIGRTDKKVSGSTGGNRRKRMDRTRRDDHRACAERTAGDGGSYILHRVAVGHKSLNAVECLNADLMPDRPLAARRHDKVDFHIDLLGKKLDDADADRSAGRAADADDDAVFHAAGLRAGDLKSMPSRSQTSSTLAHTVSSIPSGRPQVRSVSVPILLVASTPSFPPSPDFGEAKSR